METKICTFTGPILSHEVAVMFRLKYFNMLTSYCVKIRDLLYCTYFLLCLSTFAQNNKVYKLRIFNS